MKTYFRVFICFFYALLISCEGSFDADTFAINLRYPEPNSKCEKGVPNGDKLTLPFQWEPQGDISSVELILNDESIAIEAFPNEEGLFEFEFNVEYSTEYSWKIKSNEVESEARTFQTPSATPNDNNVPLAVTFDPNVIVGTTQTNSKSITVNWSGDDKDKDGNLRYDAYWSRTDDISPDKNAGEEKNLTEATVTFSIPNFNPSEEYYILVVARDLENSSFNVFKYCQSCPN